MLATFLLSLYADPRALHSFPTRRSSDLDSRIHPQARNRLTAREDAPGDRYQRAHATVSQVAVSISGPSDDPFPRPFDVVPRSEEHTSELQSLAYLVCRLLLEKKKTQNVF